MLVIEVPRRRYEEAVRLADTLHRSVFAIADIRPGRSWGLYKDPWEPAERAWRAEDVLNDIRNALARR